MSTAWCSHCSSWLQFDWIITNNFFFKLETEVDSFSDSLEEDLEGVASLSCLR